MKLKRVFFSIFYPICVGSIFVQSVYSFPELKNPRPLFAAPSVAESFFKPVLVQGSESIPVLPSSSFSVMTRHPPEPPPQEPKTPEPQSAEAASPIITIRPLDPPASKLPGAGEPSPQTPPPEPPAVLKTAEPEPEAPGAREPLTLPVNPLPEPQAQISAALLEPKPAEQATSRTIWALVGQQVSIPFKGNGWVYLGEQENRRGIIYDSRRTETAGQTYLFRAETPGTYSLKFYRQDFIEDYIINDYVQVIISEPPLSGRGTRPPPAEPNQSQTAPSSFQPEPSAASTVKPSTETPPSAAQETDYVRQAREAYNAGRFPQAITLLDQFRELYPAGTDEAWWLYGQSFEALSPNRDIRSALDYYRRLLQEYPQSPHGTEVQRRIAYLERYSFNIRYEKKEEGR
jgi:hypothetical protein